MKLCDIMETFVSAVEETIFNDWNHEGFIGGFTSDTANFWIDGKEYVLKLCEVHAAEGCIKEGADNDRTETR